MSERYRVGAGALPDQSSWSHFSLFHRSSHKQWMLQTHKQNTLVSGSLSIRSSKKCFPDKVKRETVYSFLVVPEIGLVPRKMQYPVVERRVIGNPIFHPYGYGGGFRGSLNAATGTHEFRLGSVKEIFEAPVESS